MADKGTAIVGDDTPVGVAANSLVPVMPGDGGSGPAVPTVGIIFPSGNA